jgi:hypothetical protein
MYACAKTERHRKHRGGHSAVALRMAAYDIALTYVRRGGISVLDGTGSDELHVPTTLSPKEELAVLVG